MLPFAARSLLTRWSLALLGLVAAACTSGARAQTPVQIHQIMTALPNSPYLGKAVSVSGIVTGVMTSGGFYLTAPSSAWDTDQTTAEGIPIFYPANQNPACAVVGNVVTVTGTVANGPAITAANTPGTGITPASCTVTGSGGTVNASITLATNGTAFGQFLPYTGMPVAATAIYAVSPTGGTLDEPNEIVTSNGQFWSALGAVANNHLFRTNGIAPDEYTPAGAPSGIPTWSGNPRRLYIDSTTFGGAAIDAGVGQAVTCQAGAGAVSPGIGLIDYTLGYNRLLLFKSTVCTVSGSIAPAVAAPADALHFHVGSLNLSRFYNTLGNNVGAVAITPAAYARRLNKAALAIVNYLGQPDIVALEEVQDLATLTDIGNAVNAMAGTSYAPYLAVGNDPNSLNLGYLVSTKTVVVDSVVQESLALTYTTTSGTTAPLWERPPLVLNAEFIRPGENYKLSVFNIQITPRLGDLIGDPVLGPNIRLQRGLQALDLSRLTQQYQNAGDNLLIAGNFNAYSFNDGYVDPSDIILGRPPAANAVTLYEPTDTTSPLYNFESSIGDNTKYNIIESGNARSIEHQFVSMVGTTTAAAPLASYAAAITQPHFTTDFPADLMNDPTTAAGLTSHDGFVSSFLLPPVPTTAQISAAGLAFGSIDLGASSAPQTVSVTNTTTFQSNVVVQSVTITGANPGDFIQASGCTTLAQGSTCTVTITFTPTAVGARSATLTIATDSPSNPTLTTQLTGTGLNTTATLTPGSANFGSAYPGQTTNPTQSFVLTNTSAIAINYFGATVSGPFQLALPQPTVCPPSLAAGASCSFLVTFIPTAPGPANGTLIVSTSATGNPTLTAILTGTGLQTTATLLPATLSFPATVVGSASASQAVLFTNPNAVSLKIASVTSTAEFPVASTTCAGSLAAQSSCVVNVTFAPAGSGARTGALTVASSSTANPSLTATFNGSGVGEIDTNPTALGFGNVDVGAASTPQSFTVTNHTIVPIALTSLTVQGDYTLLSSCPATLAGLSTCNVAVTFRPTAIGVRPGTLVIATSSAKFPMVAVSLTGSGVDFTLSLDTTSGHTIAGYPQQFTSTMTSLGGFANTVNVSCITSAPGSTCLASARSGNVGASPFTDPINITTTAQYAVIGYEAFGYPGRLWTTLLALLAGAGLFFCRRGTRSLARLAVLCITLGSLALATGCSGKLPARNLNPTLPGTYTYTVIATDGFLIHTATYSLNVTVR